MGSIVNAIFYSFLNNIQVFLYDKYNVSSEVSSVCYVLPIFVSAIFAPLIGHLCDVTGNFRLMWPLSSVYVFYPFIFYLSGY